MLGDDADARRFIATLPARGYRLIAEVRQEVFGSGGATSGADIRRRTEQRPFRATEGPRRHPVTITLRKPSVGIASILHLGDEVVGSRPA